eukprot:SAG22_NODE_2495_length_2512_cov_1.362619_3_plen_167_part_01
MSAAMEPCTPSAAEAPAFAALKADLAGDLSRQPPWPDVVGDIRLLRFLRGYEGDAAAGAAAYRKMLAWRAEAGMDAVRQDIATRGLQLRWADLPAGPEVECVFPMLINAGWSKAGHLVQAENTGMMDASAVVDGIGFERFMETWKYMLELRSILQDTKSREAGVMIA